MNIPDKAYEAAIEQYSLLLNGTRLEDVGPEDHAALHEELHAILVLAAPFIAAQAPHLLADYYEEGNSGEGQDIALALREDAQDFAEWLIGRAPQ